MQWAHRITLDIGGIELEVLFTYKEERPAPAFDGSDSTLQDCGDPEEIEVLEVKTADGHPIEFDGPEFVDKWRDQMLEAIND